MVVRFFFILCDKALRERYRRGKPSSPPPPESRLSKKYEAIFYPCFRNGRYGLRPSACRYNMLHASSYPLLLSCLLFFVWRLWLTVKIRSVDHCLNSLTYSFHQTNPTDQPAEDIEQENRVKCPCGDDEVWQTFKDYFFLGLAQYIFSIDKSLWPRISEGEQMFFFYDYVILRQSPPTIIHFREP